MKMSGFECGFCGIIHVKPMPYNFNFYSTGISFEDVKEDLIEGIDWEEEVNICHSCLVDMYTKYKEKITKCTLAWPTHLVNSRKWIEENAVLH